MRRRTLLAILGTILLGCGADLPVERTGTGTGTGSGTGSGSGSGSGGVGGVGGGGSPWDPRGGETGGLGGFGGGTGGAGIGAGGAGIGAGGAGMGQDIVQICLSDLDLPEGCDPSGSWRSQVVEVRPGPNAMAYHQGCQQDAGQATLELEIDGFDASPRPRGLCVRSFDTDVVAFTFDAATCSAHVKTSIRRTNPSEFWIDDQDLTITFGSRTRATATGVFAQAGFLTCSAKVTLDLASDGLAPPAVVRTCIQDQPAACWQDGTWALTGSLVQGDTSTSCGQSAVAPAPLGLEHEGGLACVSSRTFTRPPAVSLDASCKLGVLFLESRYSLKDSWTEVTNLGIELGAPSASRGTGFAEVSAGGIVSCRAMASIVAARQ